MHIKWVFEQSLLMVCFSFLGSFKSRMNADHNIVDFGWKVSNHGGASILDFRIISENTTHCYLLTDISCSSNGGWVHARYATLNSPPKFVPILVPWSLYIQQSLRELKMEILWLKLFLLRYYISLICDGFRKLLFYIIIYFIYKDTIKGFVKGLETYIKFCRHLGL